MSAPNWPEDATLDPLIGGWSLWQRKGGHRTSTDDLLTAWLAVHVAGGQPVHRYLDLGCGIGSVLLMSAHALRPKVAIGVEAQAQSVLMARRSIAGLVDAPPLRVVESDLRDVDAALLGGPFDLVTGSPPYLPPGTGVVSRDPQRAACRFELRGGIEDYCAAAARCLAPGGRFCVVFQTTWDERVLGAAAAAGLHLVERVDVRTRSDRDEPFLGVYAFAPEPPAGPARSLGVAVRDESGELTDEYREMRRQLGLR